MLDKPETLSQGPPAPGLARELPLLPLTHTVVFPRNVSTLLLREADAHAALDEALLGGGTLVTVPASLLSQHRYSPTHEPLVGVEAQVIQGVRLPDGATNLLLVGLWRVQLQHWSKNAPDGAIMAQVTYSEPVEEEVPPVERAVVLALLRDVVQRSRTLPPRIYEAASATSDAGELADLIASELPLSLAHRQRLLGTLPVLQRLTLIRELLQRELELLHPVQPARSSDPSGLVADSEATLEHLQQREHRRLETDLLLPDLAHLRAQLHAAPLPPSVSNRAEEELDRLAMLLPGTPDYAVIRTYLQWLLSLPWQSSSVDQTDLGVATTILDAHHHGLRKVKDRVLEQLAIRKLVGGGDQSTILCFVGPPGVGKTSLGRAIAQALGRPFVRLALGGIQDEAEIRGHRRAYVNALPGRIIKAMREAGTLNPVFMLDEIDKLGLDGRGDPIAALLEVLDPEQNHAFTDHYLDVPYDLSHVIFITTANSLDDVEEALVDRLEVIEMGGYSEEEKLAIARRFLIPRQLAVNGLATTPIKFPTATIRELLRTYTFEAGVRGLERELAALCRKVARRIVEGRRYPRRINASLLPALLGPPRFDYNVVAACDEVGVATSLVWTAHGGDVLPVEVSIMDGKGNLTLTGQLGEVMQESAQAALSYTRANAKRLGIDPRRFEKVDIHVHLPEGGVPKDGPSAGITIVCALVSALSGRTLRRTVAMTGEVTLRGRVLPVGGIREKVLGAYRAGMTVAIIPAKNERELREDWPPSVARSLQIICVTTMDEVFPVAFADNPLDHPWQPRKRKPRKSEEKQPVVS